MSVASREWEAVFNSGTRMVERRVRVTKLSFFSGCAIFIYPARAVFLDMTERLGPAFGARITVRLQRTALDVPFQVVDSPGRRATMPVSIPFHSSRKGPGS